MVFLGLEPYISWRYIDFPQILGISYSHIHMYPYDRIEIHLKFSRLSTSFTKNELIFGFLKEKYLRKVIHSAVWISRVVYPQRTKKMWKSEYRQL